MELQWKVKKNCYFYAWIHLQNPAALLLPIGGSAESEFKTRAVGSGANPSACFAWVYDQFMKKKVKGTEQL